MGWRRTCLVLGVAVSLAGGARAESEGSRVELPAEQVEKIVREYLLREPEIIYQALEEMQRRQAEAAAERQRVAVAANRAQLVDRAGDPVAGNPTADVTLVEFFDYQCQYCRRVVPSLQALLAEDRDLKVVFKEFPILGEASVTAARAALAARRQDRYLPFHFALMSAKDLSLDNIMVLARSVGLDTERLAGDMHSPAIDAQLQANLTLARELGIEGTPAFVVGDELIPGAVDKTRLAQLIGEARTGCVTC
ncbi:MAG TPA: DsbA family protein [Geminicoccaceae bacterium]|nr:DsbA family protein [Geminicoccaceae bacterium]